MWLHYIDGLVQDWSISRAYCSLALSHHSLQWCHNKGHGISNHQPHDYLLNHLFRRRSKNISKLRITGLCEGNSLVTSEFPAQRAGSGKCFPLMTSSCIKFFFDRTFFPLVPTEHGVPGLIPGIFWNYFRRNVSPQQKHQQYSNKMYYILSIIYQIVLFHINQKKNLCITWHDASNRKEQQQEKEVFCVSHILLLV